MARPWLRLPIVAVLALAIVGALVPPAGAVAQGKGGKAITGDLSYKKIIGGQVCANAFDVEFEIGRHPRIGQHGRLTFRDAQLNKLVRSGEVRSYIDESGQYKEVTLFAAGAKPDVIVGYAVYSPNAGLPPDRKLVKLVKALDGDATADLIRGGPDAAAARRFVRQLNAGSGVCAYFIRVRLPPKQAAAAIDLLGLADPGAAIVKPGRAVVCAPSRVRTATLVHGGSSYDVSVRDLSNAPHSPPFDLGRVEAGSAQFGAYGTVGVSLLPPSEGGMVGVRVEGADVGSVMVTITDRATGDTWSQQLEGDAEGRGFTFVDKAPMFTPPPPTALMIAGNRSFEVSVLDPTRQGDQYVFRPGRLGRDTVRFGATGTVEVSLRAPNDRGVIGVTVDGAEVGPVVVTVTDRETGESWIRRVSDDDDPRGGAGYFVYSDPGAFHPAMGNPCPVSPTYLADLLFLVILQGSIWSGFGAGQIRDSFLPPEANGANEPRVPGDIDSDGDHDLIDVELMEAEVTRRQQATTAATSSFFELRVFDFTRDGHIDGADSFALRNYVEQELDPDTGRPVNLVPDVTGDGWVDQDDEDRMRDVLFENRGQTGLFIMFDLNRDGSLDADDKEIVDTFSSEVNAAPEDYDYDVNGDDRVNGLDVNLVDAEAKRTGGSFQPSGSRFDMNLDGYVNDDDVNELRTIIRVQLPFAPDLPVDFNGDGMKDRTDVALIRAELQRTGPGPVEPGNMFDIDSDGDLDDVDVSIAEAHVDALGNAVRADDPLPEPDEPA